MNRTTAVVEQDPLNTTPCVPNHADPVANYSSSRPTTQYGYDGNNNLTSVTDALGRLTSYAYDELDRLETITEPAIASGTSHHSIPGEVVVTTPTGTSPVTTFTYDNIGNVRSVTDALGNKTFYRYDAWSRVVSVVQPPPTGALSVPEESALSNGLNPLDVVNPELVPVTQVEYQATNQGWLQVMTDPEGRETSTQYDFLGRVATVEQPTIGNMRPKTSFVYYADSQLRSFSDQESNITDYFYDVRGRLSRVEQPAVPTGVVDAMTQAPVIARPTTHYSYDAVSRVSSMTDPLQRVTSYTYDNLDRQISIEPPDPDGSGPEISPRVDYRYDAFGNLVSVTDALGHQTGYGYDYLLRRIASVDAEGDRIDFEYDLVGNLEKLLDPDVDDGPGVVRNQTTWTYDALDRVYEETDQLGAKRTFPYDAAGNQRQMTDRNLRDVTYGYDKLYRRTNETWVGDGRQFNYSYDLVGNLLTATDSDSQAVNVEFSYDALDRMTAELQTHGLIVDVTSSQPAPVGFEHHYNLAGRHTGVNAFLNASLTGGVLSGEADFSEVYKLDDLYRVTSISQTGANVADKYVQFDYDLASQLSHVARYSDFEVDPNELVATSDFGYDEAGRLRDLTHSSASSTVIADYDFDYDAGNRLTRFDSHGAIDDFFAIYTYDKRNQLTGANYFGSSANRPGDETYVFDNNGNRELVTIGTAAPADYEPGADNRLMSNGTYTFVYDAEGNRTAKFKDENNNAQLDGGDTEVTEYEWDHRNRLTRLTERDSYAAAVDKVIEYNYDLFDRRISKTVDPDGSTGSQQPYRDIFVYDGEHIALEFHDADADGMSSVPVVSHRYLHGPVIDMILADEQIASGSDPGEVYWALADHLGSTRDVVDSSGTIVGHFVYDTFGQIVSETNPALAFRFTFTGRERDAETPDLMYYRARYYSTSEGLFISKDPIGFNAGDANLYRMVGNHPTYSRDPDGLEERGIGGRIGDNIVKPWAHGVLMAPVELAKMSGPGQIYLFFKGENPAQMWYGQMREHGLVGGSLRHGGNFLHGLVEMTSPYQVTAGNYIRYKGVFPSSLEDEKRCQAMQYGQGVAAGTVMLFSAPQVAAGVPAQFRSLRLRGNSRVVNLTPKGDLAGKDALRVSREPGYYDVIAHGDAYSVDIVTAAGKLHESVTPNVLARYLRMHTNYRGGNIRLLSCEAGRTESGFASMLSSEMEATVLAPNDILWVYSEGWFGRRAWMTVSEKTIDPFGFEAAKTPPTGQFVPFSEAAHQ